MKKYILIFRNSLEEFFVYRLNFILWRVRVIVSILVTYFLWLAIFQSKHQVFDYKKAEMLTYILLMTVVNSIVFSTQTFRIASEINYGALSNILIRPLNYLYYNFARDLADKFLNSVFSLIEIISLFFLLKPEIFIQTDILALTLFLITVFWASLIYFEISIILSFIGFWSQQTWAPRFLFFILVTFLAGTYFPLDILPEAVYNLIKLLPFAYLVYFPLKIYLGKIPTWEIYTSFAIMTFWIVFLWQAAWFIWKKGLKVYTAEGQ